MREDELLQLGMIGTGGLLIAVLIYALNLFSKIINAIFPETARKYGLSFTKENRNFFMTFALGENNVNRLTGSFHGVPIEVMLAVALRGAP